MKNEVKKESRGRLFQGDSFIFTEFNDLKVLKFIECQNPENNSSSMVYIKTENSSWHRFFLSVGFGFWEDWGKTEIEEDDGFNYIDRTANFGISDKKILKIHCEPDHDNCQIIIEFETHQKIILRNIDRNEFDSDCEVILVY